MVLLITVFQSPHFIRISPYLAYLKKLRDRSDPPEKQGGGALSSGSFVDGNTRTPITASPRPRYHCKGNRFLEHAS
jgi:hypothetical protein